MPGSADGGLAPLEPVPQGEPWVLPVVARETPKLSPTTGTARWLRDVADPRMDRLRDRDRDRDRGPFRACGDGKHLTAPPLPTEQPRPGSGTSTNGKV